jgi:hypothetical protein
MIKQEGSYIDDGGGGNESKDTGELHVELEAEVEGFFRLLWLE